MTHPRLTLISHALCPYVQRAAIALVEKDVPFERRLIDLAAKPDWFLAISPLAKVPLLLVSQSGGNGTAAIFESAVICEYIEETQEGVPLHPAGALERAHHRGWIEFASSILSDLWGFETAKDRASYDAKRDALIAKFARVEEQLGDGPFFAGRAFCLVDAAFAPIFRYFEVFDAIAPTGVLADFPRVTAWSRELAMRPSVRNAVEDDYASRLRRFLLNHDAWLLKRAV